ncbi:hypothetical protein QTN25_006418 [Entamoeba marina]
MLVRSSLTPHSLYNQNFFMNNKPSFQPLITTVIKRWSNFDDPYAILGISPNANNKQIKEQFHRLTQLHHPDQHPNDKQYSKITWAYTLLTNPEEKLKYDFERSTKSIQLHYKTPYNHIIDVGIASNLPPHINAIQNQLNMSIIQPTFSGPTGMLLAFQPTVENIIHGDFGIFDVLSLMGWAGIGWISKPSIIPFGDQTFMVSGVFNEDVKINNEGDALCGQECVIKINSNGEINGLTKGTLDVSNGFFINSADIRLSAENGGTPTIINAKHLKFVGIDLYWFMLDGFTVGFVIKLHIFGWKWFKSFFNTIDSTQIILFITSIVSEMF